MSGPWEDYAPQEAGPWQDYAPVKAKPKRSMVQDVTGAAANVNRGAGIGDELAAGFGVAEGLLTGRHRFGLDKPGNPIANNAAMIGEAYRNELAGQRGAEDQFTEAHPNAAAVARGTGMAGTALIPGGAGANALVRAPRALNMLRGAATAGLAGAGYAAVDRGTLGERAGAAAATATNPLVLGLGAAGGAMAPAAARVPKPPSETNILAQHGVSTTIPQRMGGMAKQAENLAMRAPILGPAISGSRERQVEQLNRAVALKALQPVGLGLPKHVKPGFDMVEHVDDALGGIYDRAAKMVPRAGSDQAFTADLASIAERKADLPENIAAQFDSIIANRLSRLERPDASGELVKKIHGELGTLQAEAARKGETTLSGMLGDTRRAIMGIIERASPEAGELIRKADKGWRVYSIMNDAAAAASNRGGVFLPGQLNTQVRKAGRGMGTNMTGKGKAPLQDLATAATKTLPDQFGNPGTANAVGLGALVTGAVTAPVQTAGAVAGLSAAAAPYFAMGRKIIEELSARPSSQAVQEARRAISALPLSAQDARALQRALASRFSVAAGANAQSTSRPSR